MSTHGAGSWALPRACQLEPTASVAPPTLPWLQSAERPQMTPSGLACPPGPGTEPGVFGALAPHAHGTPQGPFLKGAVRTASPTAQAGPWGLWAPAVDPFLEELLR